MINPRCAVTLLVLAIFQLSMPGMQARAADEASVQRMCKAVPLLEPDLNKMWDDETLAEVLCSMTIIITAAGLKGKRNEECEIARQIVYEESKRRGISETARLKCVERIKPAEQVDEVFSGRPRAKPQGHASEEGSADPKQYTPLFDAVDPWKEMTAAQRHMRAFYKTRMHFLQKADHKKVARSDKALTGLLLQYHNRYRSLAAAAADGGDPQGALRLSMMADEFVPNGHSHELVPFKNGRLGIKYVDDASGEVKRRMVMTPQEMTVFISKGGLSFDDLMR
jgi:hypothetical protein